MAASNPNIAKLHRLKAFPMMHEMHTKSYRVWARIKLTPGELQIYYKLEAAAPKEFSKILLADIEAKPSRKKDLWSQTCFECFIPTRQGDGYLEFNGSPSGSWNWYSFKSYRQGMSEFPLNPESVPKQVTQSRSDTSIECEWVLPLSGIRQGFLSAGQNGLQFDKVGVTMVLSTSLATTYWALSHEGVKPDFHLKSSWSATP
jgi:hypothetical protein